MTTIYLILILLIVIADSIANFGFIAQNHDASSRIMPNQKNLSLKFQSRMSLLWHRSFFVMWLLVAVLALTVSLKTWPFIVYFGVIRSSVFSWQLNYLINKNLFKRRIQYLSDSGIDGLQLRVVGWIRGLFVSSPKIRESENILYWVKWVFILISVYLCYTV